MVGAGGALGSMLRYLTAVGLQGVIGKTYWPWWTFAVNVVGCLLIGLLAGLAEQKEMFSAEVRLFLMVGILGGFTTFSSFAFESLTLMRDGRAAMAICYIAVSTALGVAAAFAGYKVAAVI